jgi:hypothetical protein
LFNRRCGRGGPPRNARHSWRNQANVRKRCSLHRRRRRRAARSRRLVAPARVEAATSLKWWRQSGARCPAQITHSRRTRRWEPAPPQHARSPCCAPRAASCARMQGSRVKAQKTMQDNANPHSMRAPRLLLLSSHRVPGGHRCRRRRRRRRCRRRCPTRLRPRRPLLRPPGPQPARPTPRRSDPTRASRSAMRASSCLSCSCWACCWACCCCTRRDEATHATAAAGRDRRRCRVPRAACRALPVQHSCNHYPCIFIS